MSNRPMLLEPLTYDEREIWLAVMCSAIAQVRKVQHEQEDLGDGLADDAAGFTYDPRPCGWPFEFWAEGKRAAVAALVKAAHRSFDARDSLRALAAELSDLRLEA